MNSIDLAKLRNLGVKAAEACGTELLHVEIAGAEKSPILRYTIDKEEGVGLDDCSRVSELLSTYLEVEDPFEGRYHLEVSSPGVDRPLFSAADYDRFKGSDAILRVPSESGKIKVLKGRILGLAGSTVLFEEENGRSMEIPYDTIARGNLIGETALGKKKRPGKKRNRAAQGRKH